MSEAALIFSSVSKRFGETIALDRLNLQVQPGELLALVGPSGSGKSTALHLIAGMIDPDEGSLTLLGHDLVGLAPGKRDVAMVWQDGALYPHLTVEQNLAFPLKARGKWGMKAVRAMAERLGLADFLVRKPAELSGGERQRVALGRALIRKPKLFLLDEPLSSLDLPLRERMRTLIRELVKETGVTTVYVTHDQGEAMAVGDRVAVMNAGRMVQIDSPNRIYREPSHEFVARFFGTPPMNLLSGKIEGDFVAGYWGRMGLGRGENGRTVHVGFRPESVSFATSETRLTVRLVRLDYQGHETIAVMDAGGAEIRLRANNGSTMPTVGETVFLHIDPADLHLFAAETGERI